MNKWCWTYDPRLSVGMLPFDLFEKQNQLLRWLAERERRGENGIVEKSRDMGVTWVCCAYAIHCWLFRDAHAFGFGSRKLDLVDRLGDPDCIFEKMRFLLDWIPGFLMPSGFTREKHAGWCKIINPSNGSTITGEGGDNIGRGGRKAAYVVDEAAFLKNPDLVDRSLSGTTNCRIDVSTPNGPGNAFARRRHSGKMPVFTLHWRDDPRKDDEWYARMKATMERVAVAQEIDIDYTASVDGIMIPGEWVRAAQKLKIPEGLPHVAGLDVAESGDDLSVLLERKGSVVGKIHSWGQTNTTETAHRAREFAEKDGARVVYYDAGGVGAGVKGVWQTSSEKLPFRAVAVQAGEAPTDTVWPSGKTSRQLCYNLRAELWWTLRRRFEKTYEHVEQGILHPPEEMISLPDHAQLAAELSQVRCERMDSGKIKVQSKREMRANGIKSPDHADALCLAFHPKGHLDVGEWRMANI